MPKSVAAKKRGNPVKVKKKRLSDGTRVTVYLIPKKGKKARNRGKAQ